MNPNPAPENDPLDRALRRWTLSSSLPPRFQENVWQRIATADRPTRNGGWARLGLLLDTVLPRPSVAAAYLSLIFALGIGAGTLAAHASSSRLETELSLRYVQSVDPYVSQRSSP